MPQGAGKLFDAMNGKSSAVYAALRPDFDLKRVRVIMRCGAFLLRLHNGRFAAGLQLFYFVPQGQINLHGATLQKISSRCKHYLKFLKVIWE